MRFSLGKCNVLTRRRLKKIPKSMEEYDVLKKKNNFRAAGTAGRGEARFSFTRGKYFIQCPSPDFTTISCSVLPFKAHPHSRRLEHAPRLPLPSFAIGSGMQRTLFMPRCIVGKSHVTWAQHKFIIAVLKRHCALKVFRCYSILTLRCNTKRFPL